MWLDTGHLHIENTFPVGSRDNSGQLPAPHTCPTPFKIASQFDAKASNLCSVDILKAQNIGSPDPTFHHTPSPPTPITTTTKVWDLSTELTQESSIECQQVSIQPQREMQKAAQVEDGTLHYSEENAWQKVLRLSHSEFQGKH